MSSKQGPRMAGMRASANAGRRRHYEAKMNAIRQEATA